jgi:hypothetical protein
MSDRSLAELQRWMQAVITHPGGVQAGINSAAARQAVDVSVEDIESIIERSRACTGIERLGVYAGAYYARLLSCLRNFFPTLLHALGEEIFDQFGLGYLQRYPSQTYTLNRLADQFVTYLEQTRAVPAVDTPAVASNRETEFRRWQDFVIDLARLEWNIDAVFDGPGSEDDPPLSPESLAGISAEAWPDARLLPAPCLRLLTFRFPVNDYFTAVREGEQPERPAPRQTFLALTRRNYIVRRHPLSAPQFALLDALAKGHTFGEAIALAAEQADDLDRLALDLNRWFANWTAAGFFQEIVSP